jgi:hypothetical protein
MVLFKGATRRLSSGSTDDASGRTESIAGCGRMQQRILHGFTQHEGRQVYFYLIFSRSRNYVTDIKETIVT